MFGLDFDNLDDPKRQALLMLAAGLLSPQSRQGGKGAQFGAALSQGIQGGLMGYNNASREKRRSAALDQETKMREMQMAEMQRGQQFNQALSQGYQPAVKPLTPNDDEGFPMPSNPEGMDFSRAMQVDPMRGLQAQSAFAQLTKKQGPEYKEVGGRLVAIGPDGKVSEAYAPPPKPEKPKYVKGDTRTVKQGNFEVSQEFDGSEWKTIGKAPLWKPDAPEKPAKPIWDAERGGFITPGGFQPVPGVSPKKEPEQDKISGAQERVSEHLGSIREYYSDLAKRGGAVSTSQPAFTNILARLGASTGGQLLGGAVGTEEQTLRDKIQSMRPLLIQEIRSATGMSAKAMDSNAELQFYLRAATDPTQSVEANMAAIDALERAYGLGAQKRSGAPGGTTQAAPKPGTVDGDYVFMGGDPADRKNWKRK